MQACDICGNVSGVLSTRTVDGGIKHYCENCIAPVRQKEIEEYPGTINDFERLLGRLGYEELKILKQTIMEALSRDNVKIKFVFHNTGYNFNKFFIDKKLNEIDAKIIPLEEKQILLEEKQRIEQNINFRQKNIELINQQKTVRDATLIDKYKEDYETALNSIETDVKKLIEEGHEMKGLMLLQENIGNIVEIHKTLDMFYDIIYKYKNALGHFKSERLRQFGHELVLLRTQWAAIDGTSSSEVVDRVAAPGLQELGFNREHWLLKPILLNETEYLLEALQILVEPEFVPFEENTEEQSSAEKTDRYISSSVKIAVWRRDYGKCVDCGSQEKLEYDHIIPVSKGGSSTERNIQLLCEKCNRKKSATIQ